MLTGSSTSSKQKTTKATTIAIGIVFAILVMSLAVGVRTSNAALPVAATKGCHNGGGDEDGARICTTSSTSQTSTSSSTSTSTTTVTTATVTTSTSDSTQGPIVQAPGISLANCGALSGIGYQSLAAGTTLSITVNGNEKMTFTVPKEPGFTWMWYWIPANGQSISTLGQQVTSAMWSSGHGQDFSFFVAQLNGHTGLVLQTDYALSQACSS